MSAVEMTITGVLEFMPSTDLQKSFIYHKEILESTLNRFIKRIALKNLFQKPALVGAIFKIISHRGQLRGSVAERLKL